MNGQTIKNELNIKTLYQKAKEDDKKFLYYHHSKSKLNTIIRKNTLDDFVIEYLWKSDIYKKELVKHQNLTKAIRDDIIENVIVNYKSSPWPSVLRNFIKAHNPTNDEIIYLFTRVSRQYDSTRIQLECWELATEKCYEIVDPKSTLYTIMKSFDTYRNEQALRRIHSICATVIFDIPERRNEIINAIAEIGNNGIIVEILKPIFKSKQIPDDVINELLSKVDLIVFKDIMVNPIAKSNISDNMYAKILLSIG